MACITQQTLEILGVKYQLITQIMGRLQNILMILIFKKFQIAFGFLQRDQITAWAEEIFILWNLMEPQVLQELPQHGLLHLRVFRELK